MCDSVCIDDGQADNSKAVQGKKEGRDLIPGLGGRASDERVKTNGETRCRLDVEWAVQRVVQV